MVVSSFFPPLIIFFKKKRERERNLLLSDILLKDMNPAAFMLSLLGEAKHPHRDIATTQTALQGRKV